jgi:hypothetical protein
MKKVTLNTIAAIIYNNNGRFLTVKFTKANGKERVLNGRLYVSKYLQGSEDPQQADNRDHVTIWEGKTGGYRSVRVSAISELRAEGLNLRIGA